MMYRHTITLYDQQGNLLAEIDDKVNLKSMGYSQYKGDSYLGGPVEAAFTADGKTLWVSNYNMIGEGFSNPGCDECHGKNYDPGFVYKINTANFQIEKVIAVGAVPKYLAISKDQKKMLVSNWSSGDVSIIDLETDQEIKRVDVGAHPRGIAISSDAKTAYVAVMGSNRLAKIDLKSFDVTPIGQIGRSPRHLVLAENDSTLYVSLNSDNSILKYDLFTGAKRICTTNAGPRSMILSPDQKHIYVVNYFANTFSKINTDSMIVTEVVPTGHHPIGIAANWASSEIWVACYEGKIEVFKDFKLEQSTSKETYLFEEELAEFIRLFQPRFVASTGRVDHRDDEVQAVDTLISLVNEEVNAVKISTGESKPKSASFVADRRKGSAVSQTVMSLPGECQYHIIVGSFSIYENAVSYQAQVKSKGFEAVLLPNQGALTYVSAACFSTREDANSALPEVGQRLDVNGWIFKSR